MASKGQIKAEQFLDEVFSASELLENLAGQKLQFRDILAAAKKRGYSFTEAELRKALANKVQDKSLQTYRFCFSEAP